MANLTNIPFGLATVTIDEGGTDELKLDGISYFQAEGGELTLEPELEEITFQDFGSTPYDERINGYNGTLALVVGQNDLTLMRKLFAYHSDIIDSVSSDTVGFTDEKIGASMRAKAVKVRIHPREMGADASLDIVIYKMSGIGAFTRTYESAQGTYPVEMKMYPRDDADPTQAGNYYYVGPQDPNEPVV